jgi:hypothetical protein
MRRYAIFSFGDKGWQRKVWYGYESVPSESQISRMLYERGLPSLSTNEFHSNKQKYFINFYFSERIVLYLCKDE